MTEKLCKMMVHKMPDDLRHRLRVISADIRISMSDIIINLIKDFVDRQTGRRGRDEF